MEISQNILMWDGQEIMSDVFALTSYQGRGGDVSWNGNKLYKRIIESLKLIAIITVHGSLCISQTEISVQLASIQNYITISINNFLLI